jgi:hypothetical protein
MSTFKNQSSVIIEITRPLFDLSDGAIAAVIVNAEFLANRAMEVEDQESLKAKVLWLTAHNMIEQAELEIANRN